jgi:hypothetical protein
VRAGLERRAAALAPVLDQLHRAPRGPGRLGHPHAEEARLGEGEKGLRLSLVQPLFHTELE